MTMRCRRRPAEDPLEFHMDTVATSFALLDSWPHILFLDINIFFLYIAYVEWRTFVKMPNMDKKKLPLKGIIHFVKYLKYFCFFIKCDIVKWDQYLYLNYSKTNYVMTDMLPRRIVLKLRLESAVDRRFPEFYSKPVGTYEVIFQI